MRDISFLNAKTALITGASGGIGSAIAKKFASYGMRLLLTGRNEEALFKTASAVSAAGGEALCLAGDITKADFRAQLLATAQEHFGGLDVLVNNAGVAQSEAIEEISEESFDRIMNINVRVPFFLTQAALPLLKQSDMGTVLNIGSVISHKGYPLQSVYAASKHAVLGWSKSLANEYFEEGIRVHVISPGGVYTNLIKIARPDLTPEGMTLPEDIAEVAGFYLEMRKADAVIDEIEVHRPKKAPFA